MKHVSPYRLWPLLLLFFAAATARAQPGGWGVDPTKYQYSMLMVAQIQVNNVSDHQLNNHLAAFSDGQIRAYAVPILFNGQAYYFLNFFSNVYKGDSLYFRAFLGADQKIYESIDTVVFRHAQVLGGVADPVQIHLNLGDQPLIYSLSEVNYMENSCPAVVDVQASDKQNSEGNDLAFSIIGGADAARFSINQQTGLLSWLNYVPVIAMPGDADGDNLYEVEVKVADASGLFDVQKITVTVVPTVPPAPIVCPENLTLLSSSNGAGDCGAVTNLAALPLSDLCAGNSLSYQLTGATTGSGEGQVPASRVFAVGVTTVSYTMALGGGSSCTFTVTVQDDEAPAITCPANITVAPTVTNPCSAVVNGIDASYSDNCSGSSLTFTLSGATTGSGSGQASGETFLFGSTTMAYTLTDGVGLTSGCMFTLTVTGCSMDLEFSGTIKWDQDGTSGVNNATVNLTGAGTGNDLTDSNGDYLISIPPTTGNFTLKPVKNINRLNGVSSADILAIQKHVTNSIPITNPYKLIAADVNRSNSITTLDANLLNQCLLGNPAANNIFSVFWRFVPETHSLSHPPWGFPEQINLTGVSSSQSGQNFYGVKIGDVVTSFANPANFGSAAGAGLVWRVQDQELMQGAEITVEFKADQIQNLAAWQFALRFDPLRLQLLDIQPLPVVLQLSAEHFGTFNLSEGEIRSVWTLPAGISVPEASSLFRLRFAVLKSGDLLSECLHLDDDVLPGYMYTSKLAEAGVALQFVSATGTSDPAQPKYLLLQNRPNPFVSETTVEFVLPEACEARLRIFDATGRELWQLDKAYPAGSNSEKLRLEDRDAFGLLYYDLRTRFGVLRGRMVRG